MQLSRVFADNIQISFNGIGKDVPTFTDACAVADQITSSGIEYDSVTYYSPFFST